MPLNQSPLRPDLVFLSRRVKPRLREVAPLNLTRPGMSKPAGSQPEALNLRREPAPTALAGAVRPVVEIRRPVPKTREPAALLFPAPPISTVRELTESTPLVRLNPRQSAIGSLRISGAGAMAWEGADWVTGARTVDGLTAGMDITTSGNRPLLDYVDDQAVVALRHIRKLRRALFIGRGGRPIIVRLYDGDSVAMPATPEGDAIVLLLSRIGNVLELRADPLPPNVPDPAVWQEFGFRMSAPVADSRHSSIG